MIHNTVTVEGVGELELAIGLKLMDGWRMDPPEVHTRLVQVAGRSGSLDLTDALGGRYGDRAHEFTFLSRDDSTEARTRVIEALHGKRLRYSVSMDPEHTYVGRWSVDRFDRTSPTLATVTVSVVADPYRYRSERTYTFDAAGGRLLRLESGDMPVRPTIECSTPVRVEFGGKATEVPACPPGKAYVLNDVLFTRGVNELWANSWDAGDTDWDDVEARGLTWDDLADTRWDELATLHASEGMVARSWDDLADMTWDELLSLTWDEADYKPVGEDGTELPVDTTVTITYEVGDL